MSETGFTLWFTGLSGAGQVDDRRHRDRRSSSVAACIVEPLDGDVVRTHLSKGLGFSKEDRDTNIERIGWVASRFTRLGGVAVVSAISPYEETRQARARAGRGVRHVRAASTSDASVDECARRDAKGLYAKAFAGEIKEFTGVSDPYEEPVDCRAAHRHARARSPERAPQRVLSPTSSSTAWCGRAAAVPA